MSRRIARETALQVLFQVDITKVDPDRALEYVFEEFAVPDASREFARFLVTGTLNNLAEIDKTVQSVSREWNIKQMSKVDRNILRLATHELLNCPEIPGNVTVNEAIELAKVFSSEDSGKFVNGILGVLLVKTGKRQIQGVQNREKRPETGDSAEPVSASESPALPEPAGALTVDKFIEERTLQADIEPVVKDDLS
ncbi:MAG TPA: transcription antitermination factor NusB [Verrucomicrobiae bacterium]|nr:transcription antitermination factor NusB [Verrucomicrobiae bacterium]